MRIPSVSEETILRTFFDDDKLKDTDISSCHTASLRCHRWDRISTLPAFASHLGAHAQRCSSPNKNTFLQRMSAMGHRKYSYCKKRNCSIFAPRVLPVWYWFRCTL